MVEVTGVTFEIRLQQDYGFHLEYSLLHFLSPCLSLRSLTLGEASCHIVSHLMERSTECGKELGPAVQSPRGAEACDSHMILEVGPSAPGRS